MDEACNSWPNRETWLAARWLFPYRYGELTNMSRDLWRTAGSQARDARVRRHLAAGMQAMVTKAGDVVEDLPPWRIHAICWDRLADHFLGGIPGYRPAREVP